MNQYEIKLKLEAKVNIKMPTSEETAEAIEKEIIKSLKKENKDLNFEDIQLELKMILPEKSQKQKTPLFEQIQDKIKEGQKIKCFLTTDHEKYYSDPEEQTATILSLEKDLPNTINKIKVEAEDGGTGSFNIDYGGYLGDNSFTGYPYEMKVTDWNIKQVEQEKGFYHLFTQTTIKNKDLDQVILQIEAAKMQGYFIELNKKPQQILVKIPQEHALKLPKDEDGHYFLTEKGKIYLYEEDNYDEVEAWDDLLEDC